MGKLTPYAGEDVKELAPSVSTRTARVDIRITPETKAVLTRLAKKRYRTVTSLVQEWIDRLAMEENK